MIKHIIGYSLIVSVAIYTINLQEQTITELDHNNYSLAAQLSVCNAEYNDSDEIIAHQQLVIKIMEDGASLKEANIIVDTAEDNNVSPKF
jgi:hypothetical protein